jgi:MFS superfamily sulfate permease-like transporter
VILLLKRFVLAVPAVAVAVVVGIAAVAVFDLDQEGVKVIGVLPQGLPRLAFPAVDPNQELRALGVANLAAGCFQGFAISSSASRTPVAVSAGARSQLTPLVGAVAIALLLVFAPGLLRDLPLPMLAAIVITAAVGLIEAGEARRLYRVRRSEFVLWLAAFLGVALLGVLVGIFVAILLSLGDFVRRAWRPHDAELGRLFDEANPPVRWVVVAAEPITDIDTTAADTLRDLLEEFGQEGVTLAFAELKGPVKDRLRRYGLYDAVGPDRFFPTVGTAVDAYVEATGTTWVDWEERLPR